jgi:glucose-1-phosphate cytidylyltransferase
VTAVHPPGRWGTIARDPANQGRVLEFEEKPPGDGNLINGGFFVLSPSVIDRIDGDSSIFEREPLQRLAGEGELSAFVHEGFWQPMDTLRERNMLEELWASGSAPWKRW